MVEISIPGGEKIAERTANGRLGIVGGLSILGTTGVVIPYSCSAWIHSIHRGVDVARASGCAHVGAATGETSEAAIRARYGLPDHALIDMGDFVGGTLKYLRAHAVPRVTIAGGPAKMAKLAQGRLDLHSKRGAVDLTALAERVAQAGGAPPLAEAIANANSGLHALELAQAAGFDLPALIAEGAWATAARVLAGAPSELEISSRAATGGRSQAADSGEFRAGPSPLAGEGGAIGRPKDARPSDGLWRRMRGPVCASAPRGANPSPLTLSRKGRGEARAAARSFPLPSRAGAEAADVVGVVEFAVAKILGAKRRADQNDRRALDRRARSVRRQVRRALRVRSAHPATKPARPLLPDNRRRRTA